MLFVKDSRARPTIEIERLWHFILLHPVEEQNNRDDQMAFVARQGHQQVDALDDWSVLRFNRLYQSIVRQIRQEAEAAERARQQMAMQDPGR